MGGAGRAGAQSLGGAVGLGDVACEHAGGKPVVGVVGDGNDVVGRVEGPAVRRLAAADDGVGAVVEHALLDIQPRACVAALAVVEEDPVGGAGDGALEISLGVDDVRRLAAESSVTFFRLPAAAFTISLPTSVEPVKATLSTSS